MGYYMNPENVTKVGTEIKPVATNYTELTKHVASGHGLVGLGDKRIFKVAQLIYSQGEFDYLYGAYRSGELVSIKFYSVPLTEFPDYKA